MSQSDAHHSKKVIIIGAGPAGLTSAYHLTKLGTPCILLEKSDQVGGISRTECYKEYYFDLGGHRFYTKHKKVEELWHEVLQTGFLRRRRLSRIYYNNRFFYYPLRPWNTLTGLGVWNSLLILGSYLKCRIWPSSGDATFEDWVSNRFGRRLFNTFFKTYTEKVWGIPSSDIQAEWAQQRIKDLSISKLLMNAFLSGNGNRSKSQGTVATLIEEFDYPKYGPGMMWERMAGLIEKQGSEIYYNSRVSTVYHAQDRIEAVKLNTGTRSEIVHGNHFLSSMPIRNLVNSLHPRPPQEVLKAAASLKYRDFIVVALIVNRADIFPDNWIYVHDPTMRVGRIQNFKNWSPFMVPDQSTTCLGLEYFCFQDDELWSMADEDLIDLATKELSVMKFIKKNDVLDGRVVRVPKAYPIYDAAFKPALAVLRSYLSGLQNLQVLGRNGMHRYNNQDHSMLTGMLAAENILGADHNLWQVNDESEGYLEEKQYPDDRSMESLPLPLLAALAKIDSLGMAIAFGSVCGMLVFLATIWLLFQGVQSVEFSPELLSQFYPGYSLSLSGAVLGLLYGLGTGFILGWIFAVVKNAFTAFSIYRLKRKTENLKFEDFWKDV